MAKKAPAIFAKVRACMKKIGAKPFKKLGPAMKSKLRKCLKG